ncbi:MULTISPECIES: hypothetical protein [unclassified Sphingomonas]|uniref:hypothetical protein n=1 Tax=unclassified Sphingomonas TaxID=196159 RepID=UPI000B33FC64|nr:MULTISPECIES: hypothetical protein [unclassified Sphingomonas]
MRMILFCSVLTGLAYYLLLLLLDRWQITIGSREANALLAGLCGWLVVWGVPRLLRRRS